MHENANKNKAVSDTHNVTSSIPKRGPELAVRSSTSGYSKTVNAPSPYSDESAGGDAHTHLKENEPERYPKFLYLAPTSFLPGNTSSVASPPNSAASPAISEGNNHAQDFVDESTSEFVVLENTFPESQDDVDFVEIEGVDSFQANNGGLEYSSIYSGSPNQAFYPFSDSTEPDLMDTQDSSQYHSFSLRASSSPPPPLHSSALLRSPMIESQGSRLSLGPATPPATTVVADPLTPKNRKRQASSGTSPDPWTVSAAPPPKKRARLFAQLTSPCERDTFLISNNDLSSSPPFSPSPFLVPPPTPKLEPLIFETCISPIVKPRLEPVAISSTQTALLPAYKRQNLTQWECKVFENAHWLRQMDVGAERGKRLEAEQEQQENLVYPQQAAGGMSRLEADGPMESGWLFNRLTLPASAPVSAHGPNQATVATVMLALTPDEVQVLTGVLSRLIPPMPDHVTKQKAEEGVEAEAETEAEASMNSEEQEEIEEILPSCSIQ